MITASLVHARGHTATHSNVNGSCVKVHAQNGIVGVVDTKTPLSPGLLVFTGNDFASFVQSVKAGTFIRP